MCACSCLYSSSFSPWCGFVTSLCPSMALPTQEERPCTPQSSASSNHAPHLIVQPAASPLPSHRLWHRTTSCAPLARGQKSAGSTQAGKHRGLRLFQPPVPVLRDHRRSHSCPGGRWPFRYRFLGAVKQQCALVLVPDASVPVCAPADGVQKVAAVSWEP